MNLRKSASYPTFGDTLPSGVTEIKVYGGTGLSLVECRHTGLRDAVRPGDDFVTHGCWFCRGDDQTTLGYTLPVKRLVFGPKAPALF